MKGSVTLPSGCSIHHVPIQDPYENTYNVKTPEGTYIIDTADLKPDTKPSTPPLTYEDIMGTVSSIPRPIYRPPSLDITSPWIDTTIKPINIGPIST